MNTRPKTYCTFPDCGQRNAGGGLCSSHRYQMKARGVLTPIGAIKRGPPPLPLADLYWPKVDKNGPVVRPELGQCWTWTGARHAGFGYGVVSNRPGIGATTAHRVSWQLAHGPVPPGMHVLHRCDNPPCSNPAHLFLGTHADNMRDMGVKGRRKGRGGIGGEANPGAKLSEAAVAAIRAEHATGQFKQRDLAAKYKVSQSTIWMAVHGLTWKAGASRAA